MEPFIIVGYFTRNTFYEDHAELLVKSLVKYDIPYYVEGIDGLGSWVANVNYKPAFIKRMMNKFPKYNIVYVDCDAEFFGYPKLFGKIQTNIAVHRFDRSHFYKSLSGFEILSGTIFLRNTDETYELIERWEKECKRHPHRWDQKSLEKVLDGFYNLPEAYCMIYNITHKIERPIIVHYQASRRVRKNKGRLPKSRLQEPLPQVLSKSV